MENRYVPGAHNVLCDRTGFKVKSTEVRKEWTGAVVRSVSFEDRHPQDFLRAVEDRQAVRDARTESTDTFLSTNEVSRDDL